MRIAGPRDLVATLEAHPLLPEGGGDRFNGYGVLGATFQSGDVLAVRRCAVSSIGPGYTSVWHRGPGGVWTFFQDVGVQSGCSKYFATEADHVERASIRVMWADAARFMVLIDDGATLEWHVRLADAWIPDAIGRVAQRLPDPVWSHPLLVNALAAAGGSLLGVGRLRLAGRTPNAFAFEARPAGVWRIDDSRAVLRGRHLGAPVTAHVQARLGDFWIPRRPLFVVARAHLASIAPGRA